MGVSGGPGPAAWALRVHLCLRTAWEELTPAPAHYRGDGEGAHDHPLQPHAWLLRSVSVAEASAWAPLVPEKHLPVSLGTPSRPAGMGSARSVPPSSTGVSGHMTSIPAGELCGPPGPGFRGSGVSQAPAFSPCQGLGDQHGVRKKTRGPGRLVPREVTG